MNRTYSNLFECEYPQIEKLYWIKHPDYEIEVSNYGHFRNIGTDKDFRNYTGKIIPVLVYEAFHNVKLRPYTSVISANLNPYDMRIENLIIHDPNDRELRQQYKRFREETVAQMIKREPSIPKSLEPEEYFKMLGIPVKILNMWKKSKLSERQLV